MGCRVSALCLTGNLRNVLDLSGCSDKRQHVGVDAAASVFHVELGSTGSSCIIAVDHLCILSDSSIAANKPVRSAVDGFCFRSIVPRRVVEPVFSTKPSAKVVASTVAQREIC